MNAAELKPNAKNYDLSLWSILKGDDQGITALLLFLPIFIIVVLNAFNTLYIITDYPAYLEHIHAFQTDPYSYEFYNKYPAFYFIFMGSIGILGIDTIFEIKLLFGLIDLVNVALIIKMARLVTPVSKKIPFFIGFLYFFFPIHLYFLKMGENDVVSIFFFVSAVNFFLEKRYGRSAVMLGFGIMFKIFPIFFLLPVTHFFLRRKQLGKCILYWLLIGLVFVLISLPYILNDVQNNSMSYFEGIFLHTNRMSTGNSYSRAVSFFYETLFKIWFIDISVLFLLQILALGILFIYFYYQYKIPTNRDIIAMSFFSLFTISLLMFQDNHTNFTRYLPFLLIMLFTNSKIDMNYHRAIHVVIIYGLILFASQILLIFLFDNYAPFYSIYYIYYFIYLWAVWNTSSLEKNISCIIFILLFITYEIAQKIDVLYYFEPNPIVWSMFLLRTLLLLPLVFVFAQNAALWFSKRKIR